MPDPIIEPITMAVAENNPIPCTKCGVAGSLLFWLSFRGEAEESGTRDLS